MQKVAGNLLQQLRKEMVKSWTGVCLQRQHSWESPEKIKEAEHDSGVQGAEGGF